MTRHDLVPETMTIAAVVVVVVVAATSCASPANDDLAITRARNAMFLERADWARRYFAEDFERHPERVNSLREGAYAWLSGYQRSRAEARALLARYLELRPDDQGALRTYLGELLVNRDLELGRRLAEGLDDSAEALVLRARLWIDDDPELADEYVTQAMAKSPDSGAAFALGAVVAERLGNNEEALERALRAARLQPFNYQIVYQLSRLWRRVGDEERSSRALELHQKLAELAADGTRPRLAPAAEIELLEELAEELPATDCEYRKRLVTAHIANRDLAAAEDLADEFLERCSVGVAELVSLASLAEDRGRRSFALELLSRVEAADPGNAAATTAFAVAAIDEGRIGDARALIEKGRERDPWLAYYDYLDGRIAKAEGDLQAASMYFERALDLAPWQAEWRIELIETYRALGATERARAVAAAVPEQSPEWTSYAERHGWALGL